MIEHSQEMRRLYDKLKQPQNKKPLAMPRAIMLMEKCVEHKIQDCFIKQLHFNDLYLMILSLDIANLKQIIRQQKRQEMQRRGIAPVRDISQADAVKMLKGG